MTQRDMFRITLNNFRYVVVRNGRAMRFDFTWEYSQPDGLRLAATAEGCLAYANADGVTWHFNKTSSRGAWITTQVPNDQLIDWVADKLAQSGMMKGLLEEQALATQARDMISGPQPDVDFKILEEL
jgi:hypothetical protein